MKRFLKKYKFAILYVFVLFILSCLVTLINLGFSKMFVGEDSGVGYYFPHIIIKLASYTWDSFTVPGKINVTSLSNLLWTLFTFLLYLTGISGVVVSRIVYALFFIISGSGMFYLINIIYKVFVNTPEQKRRIVYFFAFVGSLLYMFNHFSMELTSFPIIPYHMSYMLFPWLTALFIYNLQIRTSFFSVFIFTITTLIFFSGNPSNTVAIAFFLICYFIFFSRRIFTGKTKPILFITGFFILLLLFSSYIYLPIFSIKSNPYGYTGTSYDQLGSLYLNSSLTSFSNLFLMAGNPIWESFPYYTLYNSNIFFILLGYGIPIFIFILVLLTPSFKKLKLFLLFTVVITLFLASGVHPPFSNIFEYLFLHIPYFEIYRAVYLKFGYFIVFSYSILLGVTLYEFYFILKKVKLEMLILIIPILILIYNTPFFTGQIPNKNYLTNIPREYQNASQLLSNTPTDDYKILSLPPTPNGGGPLLQWKNDKYVGPNPDVFFFDRPTLDSYWFIGNGFNRLNTDDSWTGNRFEKNIDSVLKLSGILNIKYLLIHKDFVEEYSFPPSNIPLKIDGRLKSQTLINILDDTKGVKKIHSNRYFDLYELSNTYTLPHFYIPQNVVFCCSTLKQVFAYMTTHSETDSALISPGSNLKNLQLSHPQTINVKKLNQTKYQVSVGNTDYPFLLVFSETYNANWKASVMVSGKQMPIPEKNHILANGYANAWLIAPIHNQNQITVDIEFQSQKYFDIGLAIALFTFIICCCYILMSRFKKENK